MLSSFITYRAVFTAIVYAASLPEATNIPVRRSYKVRRCPLFIRQRLERFGNRFNSVPTVITVSVFIYVSAVIAVSIFVRLAGLICLSEFFSYSASPVEALYSPAKGAEIFKVRSEKAVAATVLRLSVVIT